MPALVKSSVGSSPGTSGELGTTRWPCRSKYFRKDARISLGCTSLFYSSASQALCARSLRVTRCAGLEPLARRDCRTIARDGLGVERRADRRALQPPGDGLLEERGFVDLAEHLVDGGRWRSSRLMPSCWTCCSTRRRPRPSNRGLDARRRQRDAAVVERAVARSAAAIDVVDLVGCELAAGQPFAELCAWTARAGRAGSARWCRRPSAAAGRASTKPAATCRTA